MEYDFDYLKTKGFKVVTSHKTGKQVDKIIREDGKEFDVWISTDVVTGIVCIDDVEEIRIERDKRQDKDGNTNLIGYDDEKMRSWNISTNRGNVWNVQEVGIFTGENIELIIDTA